MALQHLRLAPQLAVLLVNPLGLGAGGLLSLRLEPVALGVGLRPNLGRVLLRLAPQPLRARVGSELRLLSAALGVHE